MLLPRQQRGKRCAGADGRPPDSPPIPDSPAGFLESCGDYSSGLRSAPLFVLGRFEQFSCVCELRHTTLPRIDSSLVPGIRAK